VRIEVTPEHEGKRLDHFLQEHLPEFSRSRLQEWIKRGRVLVDAREQKPSYALRGNEAIEVEPEAPPPLHAFAEDIPLDILYVDADLVAINKPAGMVVHAGAGQHSGTLVNALLHRFGSLSAGTEDDRPGIVHRIDKETSGVLLVARNDAAHRSLAEQFESREVEKHYLTLVQGVVRDQEGRVDRKITRHPVHRTRMTASLEHGRNAITYWKVLERFQKHTYLQVRIGTGRTHQIRVHMSSVGHPVAGDTLYGAAATPHRRFFLHASRIAFRQPTSGERVTVEAPLAPELQAWLAEVRGSG
jgi:23S rRNA pseudouridine1911/1915/1917 synthase